VSGEQIRKWLSSPEENADVEALIVKQLAGVRERTADHWTYQFTQGQTLKKKLVGHIRHMLGWAHERGDLTALPAMPKVTVHRKKKRGLVEKQQEEILKKIPEDNILA